jgi:hypothetical protein
MKTLLIAVAANVIGTLQIAGRQAAIPRPEYPQPQSRLRGLYEAIAKIPAFAGLCYTQLTDVEQEVNGLPTYDRKLKFDVKEVKAINDLVR